MTNILSTVAKQIASQIDSQPDIGPLIASGVVSNIYIDTIRDEAKVVGNISNSIHSSTTSNKGDFLKLITSLQAMQSAAELLDQALMMAASSSQNFNKAQQGQLTNGRSWVTSTLIPWIKSLWGSAWSLVTKLSTPTEWKLKGELGTGVLGLTKSSIEIKFG